MPPANAVGFVSAVPAPLSSKEFLLLVWCYWVLQWLDEPPTGIIRLLSEALDAMRLPKYFALGVRRALLDRIHDAAPAGRKEYALRALSELPKNDELPTGVGLLRVQTTDKDVVARGIKGLGHCSQRERVLKGLAEYLEDASGILDDRSESIVAIGSEQEFRSEVDRIATGTLRESSVRFFVGRTFCVLHDSAGLNADQKRALEIFAMESNLAK